MSQFLFHRGPDGYALSQSGREAQHPLTIDFDAIMRRRERGGRENLLRAVGARTGLRVIDCTAGLGADAFLLAAGGCEITLIERSNTLYLMLEDAIRRAATSAKLAAAAARMTLLRGDAKFLLSDWQDEPADVITIDPMFPSRRKRALVRGELQMLQALLGKDEALAPLVHAAIRVARQRVVVKRPLRAPPLDGLSPSGAIRGKASRFDIYAGRGQA